LFDGKGIRIGVIIRNEGHKEEEGLKLGAGRNTEADFLDQRAVSTRCPLGGKIAFVEGHVWNQEVRGISPGAVYPNKKRVVSEKCHASFERGRNFGLHRNHKSAGESSAFDIFYS
jgi:hypothetical protein